MSLAAIEAELERLSAEELRRLAIKTWSVYAQKAGVPADCGEDDPALLAAIDEAVQEADAHPGEGYSGEEIRGRLGQWTSTR